MSRIVYLSWPTSEITGGMKVVFQHVEALAEHNFSAAVATEDAQPPTWLSTKADIIPIDAIGPDDILVFPENHAGMFSQFAAEPNWKYVLCQSQYGVPRGLNGQRSYKQYGVREIICPGISVLDYCHRRFPHIPRAYIPNYIDTNVFQYQKPKQLQIAFVPRKRRVEAHFIYDLFLAEHGDLAKVPWVQIDGTTEAQVATALAKSAVFLSLSRFESFGLTTLEALASGCITAGFTGIGGREYTTSRNGFWVEEDDCLAAVAQLAEAVRLVKQAGPLHQCIVTEAIATAKRYSRKNFLEHLTRYWTTKLEEHAQTTSG